MDTPEFSSYSRTGMPEVLSRGAGPQEVTAGGSSHQFIHRISRLEASYAELAGNLARVEKEISHRKGWSESVDSRLQLLESQHSQLAASEHYKPQQASNPDPSYQEGHRRHEEQVLGFSEISSSQHRPFIHSHSSSPITSVPPPRAFPGGVTRKELQENEELKKLQEQNKELQAKVQQLLSERMGMHEKSENINDPLHLSAVLKMYEMLRVHDWERFRSFSPSLAHETGIIKKLFEACEKDIQQRTDKILKGIGIPPSNDAMTNSKQGLMQAIRSLFRYSYHRDDYEFYRKIFMEPPVEAVWKIDESSWQDLEHVDKIGRELWRKPVTDNMSWDPARKLAFRRPEYSEKMTVKDPYWKYYGIEQAMYNQLVSRPMDPRSGPTTE